MTTKTNLESKLSNSFLDVDTPPTQIMHRLGLDMGGSLCKMAYIEGEQGDNTSRKFTDTIMQFVKSKTVNVEKDEALQISIPGFGIVHFFRFLTKDITAIVNIIKDYDDVISQLNFICVTGGGSIKYEELFKDVLDVAFLQHDELDTVVHGMAYLIKHIKNECFYYADSDDENKVGKRITKKVDEENFYPFLLINIGTGVSIVKVNGPNDITRVSGTALGGGTFLGLCRLLTKAKNFDNALDFAERGDASKVNMLVEDIYSKEKTPYNLKPDLTASFFAKNISQNDEEKEENVSDEDVCRALCIMIAQNVTQLATLNAGLHNVTRIFFTGNFLRHNEIALKTIQENMKVWASFGRYKLDWFFSLHEGYFGAIGALLLQEQQQVLKQSNNSTKQ